MIAAACTGAAHATSAKCTDTHTTSASTRTSSPPRLALVQTRQRSSKSCRRCRHPCLCQRLNLSLLIFLSRRCSEWPPQQPRSSIKAQTVETAVIPKSQLNRSTLCFDFFHPTVRTSLLPLFWVSKELTHHNYDNDTPTPIMPTQQEKHQRRLHKKSNVPRSVPLLIPLRAFICTYVHVQEEITEKKTAVASISAINSIVVEHK
mmetsp:Transcript_3058/g.8620  ORF Transcript_3058/g.8620 Transcript_3058/m.8620 type:complete len:204 (-) Transcript_3058:26-637(-)